MSLSSADFFVRPRLVLAGIVLSSLLAYLVPWSVPVAAAPLEISATGDPSSATLSQVGDSTLWSNAGTVDGQAIDLRATVVFIDTVSVGATTSGDNPRFLITGGPGLAEIEWRVFVAGTNQPIFGSPQWTINDIDGNYGQPTTLETVVPSLEGLVNYQLEPDTELSTSTNNGQLTVSGTYAGTNEANNTPNGTSASRSQAAVRFNWNERSRWRITYQTHSSSGRGYEHDGNGEFAFSSNLQSFLIPQIDLDADDSSVEEAGSNEYRGFHVNDNQPVGIVDTDVSIDIAGSLSGATVELNNFQSGDELLVAGSTSGTVAGTSITYSVSGNSIDFSGSGTPAEYVQALQAVTYNLPANSTALVDREFSIFVSTTSSPSNIATSTVSFTQDTDGDLVPDAYENLAGTNLNDPLEFADADGDLVPDYIEEQDGTFVDEAASFANSDEGGTPDYVEVTYYVNAGLPASDSALTADDGRDTDEDGTSDYAELLAETNPRARPVLTPGLGGDYGVVEGETAGFSLSLTTVPQGPVTITFSANDLYDFGSGFGTAHAVTLATETTESGTQVVPALVSITRADNSVDEQTPTYSESIVYTVASSIDSDYDAYPDVTVPITVTNNDELGVNISNESGLTLTEEGAAGTYAVVLESQPTDRVTVTLVNPDSERLSFDVSEFTFGPDDWNTPQTTTLTPNADDDVVTQELALNFEITSPGDFAYAALATVARGLTILDNDTPELVLSTPEDITEEETGSFTVNLSAEPQGEVTVFLESTDSDALNVVNDSQTVVFDSSNWNRPQTITYAGAPDADFNDETVEITATVTNISNDDDTAFASLRGGVTVGVSDTTTPAIVVSQITAEVAENGGSQTIELSLAAQPNAPVRLDLSTLSPKLTFSPTTLTFDETNWNQPRTVTLTGVSDDIDRETTALLNIAVNEDVSDSNFVDTPARTVEVTILDDDTAGIILEPATLTVDEEGTGSVRVRLSSEPTTPLTLTLDVSDSSRLAGLPATVNFDAENWNVFQTLDFAALADPDVINNDVEITLGAVDQTGTTYENVALRSTVVTVSDIDAPNLLLSTSQLTIAEDGAGNTGEFTVALTQQPQQEVTVTIVLDNPDEATFEPLTLTFGPADWNQPQTVTVTGVSDRKIFEDTATLTLTTGALGDVDFQNLSRTVDLTLTDTDVDTDGDLVPDDQEVLDGTSPSDALDYLDTDKDLVPDYVETAYQPLYDLPATDPALAGSVLDGDEGGTPDYVETILYPNAGLVATSPTDAQNDTLDTDQDGVSDYRELLDGTDVLDPSVYEDTDGDLVPDVVETLAGTDPEDATSFVDTDGDLVPDYVETTLAINQDRTPSDPNDPESYADTDNDLVPDYVETAYQTNTDREATDPVDGADFLNGNGGVLPDYVGSVLFPNLGLPALDSETGDDTQDTDGDGVPDYIELAATPRTDIRDGRDYADTDGDKHPDYLEELADSDPTDSASVPADSDGDGVPDVLEEYLGTDPREATEPARDTDGDGYSDYLELISGSDPITADSTPLDSDGDGVPDAAEIMQGTDPNNPLDYQDRDGDLVPDYVEMLEGSDASDSADFLDTDNSGTPNYVEVVLRASLGLGATDPNLGTDDALNSDGGPLNDYQELLQGSNPTLAADDLDLDLDNVPDEIEKAAPNNGDSNGDGIQDYLQTNVSANINPVTGRYATLEVQGECATITGYELVSEASLLEAENFDFEIGLHDFELRCAEAGGEARVTVYWDRAYDTDLWTYRKYYPGSGEYRNIDALVTTQTREVSGRGAVTVSEYTVVDGGDLDLDGEANGVILDPAGPTVSTLRSVRLLRTGGQALQRNVIPVFMIVVGLSYLYSLTRPQSSLDKK